jgi:hypothetical protein
VCGSWLQIFLFLFFIRHLSVGHMRLLLVFTVANLVSC